MNHSRLKYLTIILLVFFLAGTFFYSYFNRGNDILPSTERRFPVMGTICCFRLTGESGTSAEKLKEAADAVQDTFYRIEKKSAEFNPTSL